MTARKVIAQWVRYGRRSLKAKKEARAAAKVVYSTRAQKRRARTDRVISLYLENQEEVDRLCFEEPDTLILTQIELLTRRIDSLSGTAAAAGGERAGVNAYAGIGKAMAGAVTAGGAAGSATRALPPPSLSSRQSAALAEVPTWQEAFDKAMVSRKHWEQGQNQAQHSALEALPARGGFLGSIALVPQQRRSANEGEVLAQLRAERKRLSVLLQRFDAQMQRKNRNRVDEQSVIDQVEAFQEEQRAAMAARAQELREKRQREREERQRREEEDARRRREVEEQLRRQEEEEREMQRLMREWEEDEQRRRRLAQETESRRLREEEEQEKEAREEEGRLRERREEQSREDRRRRMEHTWALDKAFDDFEQACDSSGVEQMLEAALTELSAHTGIGTPPGTTPPETLSPSLDQVAGGSLARGSSAGGDWMAKAIAALGGDDADSSEGEATTEAALGGGGASADDLELLRFTEAIVERIEQLHGQK